MTSLCALRVRATDVKSLPGITAPFGDVFDPMNLIDRTSVAEMRRYREAEITHGRVAMLASLGFLVGEQLEDFPLFFNFDGNITGGTAFPTSSSHTAHISANYALRTDYLRPTI